MKMTPKKIAVIAVLAIIAIIAAIFLAKPGASGTVKIVNANTVSDSTIRFNDKELKPLAGTASDYSLAPGDYTLKVTASGYTPFSTHFTVHKGDTLTVNVTLKPKSDPTIKSIGQIVFPPSTPSNMSVVNTVYFYNKTWAIVTIKTPDGNEGVIVAQYSASNSVWNVVLGPGTLFLQSDVQSLPSDVAKNMESYVDTSGGEGE